VKTTYNKKELQELVYSVSNKDIKDLTHIEKEVLYRLEYLQYKQVIENIRIKRDSLQLYKPNQFLTFYIPDGKTPDDILFGCQSCLKNKITHIRNSSKCNMNCPFCYHIGLDFPAVPKECYRTNFFDTVLDKEQLVILLEKQIISKVNAIGWIGKEPLLEMEKIEEVGPVLKRNKVYQYLYTNGTLITKEILNKLKEAGLNELRFNLQASNFDIDVLNKMKQAVDIIENVAIETPIYSDSFKNIIANKDFILNSGIKQINMPELQVSPRTIAHFAKKEGEMYRNRRGYTSPISSRIYVYCLLEMACNEKWPMIINDCSNETKYYRDTPFIPDDVISGVILHRTQFNFLPPNHYLYLIDTYVGEEIEIF
jgi:pyruvate formate-lyase activating enzyme-like uncharacterized protein